MDKIFKWFTIPDDNLALVQIAWFTKSFDVEEFEGVDKLLWLFLRYCADLDLPALRQYLELFLKTEGKKNIKKYAIRLETMENYQYSEPASFAEACRVIFSSVLEAYERITGTSLSERTFKSDMRQFMSERKVERIQRLMATSFPKLSDGSDIDDVSQDMQEQLSKIDTTYNVEKLMDLDFMSGDVSVSKGVNKKRFLYKTGIPCIDGDTGGVYTQTVTSFTGSPGTGKTRFAVAHQVYPALRAGIDVLFDELELSEMEVQNMLIAHHIVHLYEGNVKIPDSDMNTGRLTMEQRRYYEAAKMDLFESGKYGKITIRTGELVVETLRQDMLSYLRHNRNTQLWVIDYAGLAKSKPTGRYARYLEEYEIITEVYKQSKEISKIADIAVFIVNQFNEKGIQAAYAGKTILPGYIQGGQIATRHADYDLVMCMTEEQELAGMATLSTLKKRAAKGFKNTPIVRDLAVSIFRQMKQ